MNSAANVQMLRTKSCILALVIICIAGRNATGVVAVNRQEMRQKQQWVAKSFLSAQAPPPFSFTYDGEAWPPLASVWQRTQTEARLGGQRTQHVLTWTNAASDLRVKCVVVEYADYPVVEWTVYLKDIGTNLTPVLQDIEGLDTSFSRPSGPEFVLHSNHGDLCALDSYAPYQITLNPSVVTNFSPAGSGKSCDGRAGWPYYNLQMPGGGVIVAIGWPGQWASSFQRDAAGQLRVQAGQQRTHLRLKPGEEIRTPLIALLFWQGTEIERGQNLWRRWYLAHEIPRVNGQPPSPFMAIGGDSIREVSDYLKAGMKPDVLWRDADTKPYDWYPTEGGPAKGNTAWFNTGTWEVDTNHYPHGFSPLSTAVHQLGMKFLLWFEPERVGHPGSWLATQHPEWLLTGDNNTGGQILDEGNPVAFHWLTNHIDGMIKANGIDWYREDMNGGGPLAAWRNHDAPERQGITENFYVQAHLAYWDALLAMNPGLRIDSCASGGRRNDLESMRRAVPLWRSDVVQVVDAATLGDVNQGLTYGLSAWLPFQGTACNGFWDPYSFRSSYVTAFDNGGINAANVAAQQQAWAEWKALAPIMLNGDYYPLTSYSLSNNVWMAWQFDRGETGEGFVQAFRRRNSEEGINTFRLHALNARAKYQVKNLDAKDSVEVFGRDLIEQGLPVAIPSKPGAAVIFYKRM